MKKVCDKILVYTLKLIFKVPFQEDVFPYSWKDICMSAIGEQE